MPALTCWMMQRLLLLQPSRSRYRLMARPLRETASSPTVTVSDSVPLQIEDAQRSPTPPRAYNATRVHARNPTTQRMGYIRGLSVEAITRGIWLRGADGKSLRPGWREEIDKLLTTMCVSAERGEVTCGQRYPRHFSP